MNASEKLLRRQRAEYLRDAAVRLARGTKPDGNVEIAGALMRIHEFKNRDLAIQYLTPLHASRRPSWLIVRAAGVKVLECEFDGQRTTRLRYVAGNWERALRDRF